MRALSREKSIASLVQPDVSAAGIEIKDELAAGEVGKRDRAAAVARQSEAGALLPGRLAPICVLAAR